MKSATLQNEAKAQFLDQFLEDMAGEELDEYGEMQLYATAYKHHHRFDDDYFCEFNEYQH